MNRYVYKCEDCGENNEHITPHKKFNKKRLCDYCQRKRQSKRQNEKRWKENPDTKKYRCGNA